MSRIYFYTDVEWKGLIVPFSCSLQDSPQALLDDPYFLRYYLCQVLKLPVNAIFAEEILYILHLTHRDQDLIPLILQEVEYHDAYIYLPNYEQVYKINVPAIIRDYKPHLEINVKEATLKDLDYITGSAISDFLTFLRTSALSHMYQTQLGAWKFKDPEIQSLTELYLLQ